MKHLLLVTLTLFSWLPANNNVVNLASFPRSGNHWVRFLVEEATHISTSSTYRDGDFKHKKNPFPLDGFSVRNGYFGGCRLPSTNDPLLLKTHFPWLTHKEHRYKNAHTICLIRHPVDSIYSYYEYQRKLNSIQVGSVIDLEYIESRIKGWVKFYKYWEKQEGVLLIKYEDLQKDPETMITQILLHAGFTFEEEDVKRAIKKHAPFGHPLKHIDKYTTDQIKLIKEIAGDSLDRYEYTL